VTDLGKLPGSWVFASPVIGDVDGDGRLEIAIAGHPSPESLVAARVTPVPA